jgi:hypothetical protein
MVVGDFHVGRLPVIPTENQAPLLIDSHAPETLEIAGEGFEPVAGWDSQILQNFGGVFRVSFSGQVTHFNVFGISSRMRL